MIREASVKLFKNNTLMLLLIFSIIFGLRLNSSTRAVLTWDESAYFVVAQDLARGGSLYQSSWDHKGPILYFLLVPVIKIFGNNIFSLRIFTTFYLILSMFFVYLISKIFFEEQISLIPPLLYGLFFTISGLGGLASNGEIFMMLPAIIATYSFVSYIQNRKRYFLGLSLCGFFSLAAALIKATAFFTVILLPAILIYRKIKYDDYEWAQFYKDALSYLSGCTIIGIAILSYFIFHKSLAEFYNAYFVFNIRYVNILPVDEGVRNLAFLLAMFMLSVFIAIFFVILKNRSYSGNKRFIAYFVIGLSIFSLIGVISCRYMFSHYFLQMGLPFSLLAGLAFSALKLNSKVLKRAVSIGVLILMVISFWPARLQSFLREYKYRKNDIRYKVADYILAHTTDKDTIFVFRGDYIIYFLSERKAPVKYFAWFHHYFYDGVLKIKDYAEPLFYKNKPKYIIDNQRYFEVEYIKKFIIDNYSVAEKMDNYILYKLNK